MGKLRPQKQDSSQQLGKNNDEAGRSTYPSPSLLRLLPHPSTEEGPTSGQQDPRPWLPWWRHVGVSGPAEEASPGQSPSLGTGLQGTHTVLWALEKLGTEKAGWGQRRRGSPRPCQQPLHRVCREQKGRVRQCGFLHLSLQPPAGAER